MTSRKLDSIRDTHNDLRRELASADAEDHGTICRRYADRIAAWECDTAEEIDALNALCRAVGL